VFCTRPWRVARVAHLESWLVSRFLQRRATRSGCPQARLQLRLEGGTLGLLPNDSGSVGSVVDLGLERRGREEQPEAGAVPPGALVEEAQRIDAWPRARSLRAQGASSLEFLYEVLGWVSVYLHLAAV
jgi:hypothetical protein